MSKSGFDFLVIKDIRILNSDMKESLYILHGSRTGNSKAAAELAREYAEFQGIRSRVESMEEFDPEKLARYSHLLIAVSTHGEGDPPLQAEPFYQYIYNSTNGEIGNLKYSILALGDSSYKHFCKTGKDINDRLKELGAHPFYPVVECDIDFEDNAKEWVKSVVDQLKDEIATVPVSKKQTDSFVFELKLDEIEGDYYKAKITDKELLTGEKSTKRTYNIRLDLKNSGIEFDPGDSIGIFCPNSQLFVDQIIRTLGFDPTHVVKVKDEQQLLKHALIHEYELTMITPVVMQKYAEIISDASLYGILESKKATQEYTQTSDILDLVTDFPGKITPEEFISVLRKLAPRLYSVASSRKVLAENVDLAVGIIEYTITGREHIGVGSSFIADRLEVGEKVPVMLESNGKFRLPDDTSVPIIMIGTSTGVSPYRAFLQERELSGKGKNWLIFGDRNSATDFIYRKDFKSFMDKGVLTRLDTAFSRDNVQKKYVTHLILRHSEEIYRWMEQGACIYLCGNKRTMAVDVRKAFTDIIAAGAGVSVEKAAIILENLKKERRFQEDVY